MKTRKNFWASLIITLGWLLLVFIIEVMRYSTLGPVLPFMWVVAAFFITYQILRVLQYLPDVLEKQEPVRPAQRRVDDLLKRMSEDELDVLRSRLADPGDSDYEPLEDLLLENPGKRKHR